METWFLNLVLGLCLSVPLLCLPGPLMAGTPDSSSTGFYDSTATNGPSSLEYNTSSTSHSSESFSPSQRNLLTRTAATHTEETHTDEPRATGTRTAGTHTAGTHTDETHATGTHTDETHAAGTHTAGTHTAAAGNVEDTEQPQTLRETSTRSVETSRLSTEPLTTEASSSSRDWTLLLKTDRLPDVSPVVSQKMMSWMSTEDSSLPQDSPDSTLRLGDAMSSASQTEVLTNGTYRSTTISRAGERTLLSVTSSSKNSTSSAFTAVSNSHQPPSTFSIPASGGTRTEDYTHSAPSTRTDSRDTRDQHITQSFGGSFSEIGSPEASSETQTLFGPLNATQHKLISTSEETSDSTPPLRVTRPSTDPSDISVASTPSVISSVGSPTNVSETYQGSGSSVRPSTESSTGALSSSSQTQEGTEGMSTKTSDETVGFTLTTALPMISSSTTVEHSSPTVTPPMSTKVFLTTTAVTVTERSHMTEKETSKSTASSTTPITSLLPATSSFRFSSTTSSSTPASSTQVTFASTTSSTTASTLGQQTSAVQPTHRYSTTQAQQPSTAMAEPTNVPTPQLETSAGTLRVTTALSQHITTVHTPSTPTRSTEALQTTRKQTEWATTEPMVTTPPIDDVPTKAAPPGNPCVSNPCMNGGMCVSYEGHQFICHCQQAWTGLTCNQDVDECQRDPCPVGSRCVNTRGSFSCECPLGFDLEDGRTCTRARTFLGTFSVNRLSHDPSIFKSATVHEIQREIIQLLNASLSILRGYSRSTLSNKEEDKVLILAVNMFSISTDVTTAEVNNSIQMFLRNCSSSLSHCRIVLHHQLTYHVDSLCLAQKIQCDTERSTCADNNGAATCQCQQGYYKHNPDDLSCLDCGDGYKLENGTCVPCMFGFGGFNCGNFYKLIAVVVSPAGGGLLLILIIVLIVTCCKKDKNDINKIIFKNGDLQMSPYADFPKSNRISMEWGRETIEMQENGSTKNLLQMNDIYYSPALRNSDLERNGLYPFTGLPGSRHSCIYPAQWNPSFISDDSRRRDYF